MRTLASLPDLIRRIDYYFPPPGAAPPPPPLPQVTVVRAGNGWRYALVALLAGAVGAGAVLTLS
jgi:ubiquinone biosynthesis protein